MPATQAVQEQFEAALGSFVEKASKDPYVFAILLFGSLSHDVVWEKSDIDLVVVTSDGKVGAGAESPRSLSFVENDVNLHAMVMSRTAFRKAIEGSVGGWSAMLANGRLVFARDETVRDLHESVTRLGLRDRQVELLRSATGVLLPLWKAEKWFHVRGDMDYAFLFLTFCVLGLARVEVYRAGQIAGREVIQQAMAINPDLFSALYTDLIRGPKTAKQIGGAIASIDGYLTEHCHTLFGPVLDYLALAGASRSVTEIETHFRNEMGVEGVGLACEWLADKQVITKVSSTVYLTTRSRVPLEEMAFYYDPAGGRDTMG